MKTKKMKQYKNAFILIATGIIIVLCALFPVLTAKIQDAMADDNVSYEEVKTMQFFKERSPSENLVLLRSGTSATISEEKTKLKSKNMEEIIMTRFLAYKSGFISGKYDFLGSVVTNQAMINVNVSEDSIKEGWFLFGYTDAIEFYEDRFSKGLDIRNIRTNDVVKDLYAKRVTDYNVTNKENVPICKFKIKKL